MKGTYRIYLFLFLFIIPIGFVSANSLNGLSVLISANGDVPAVSVSCTTTRNYTLALVHRVGDFDSYSRGVVQRKYCDSGYITFDSFNIVTSILGYIGDPTWWLYVRTPLEYIIKDTTGLGSGINCNATVCPLLNEDGAFNNYNKGVYVASSTYWTTIGAGPIFDTTDNVTWFNSADGDGTSNFIVTLPPATSTPPIATTTPPTATTTSTGNSSVLFLPGFEASRLYTERLISCTVDCEDTLWEPNGNSDVEALFMNSDGTSVDSSVYTRDVLEEAYGALNIYKSFFTKLAEMKTDGDIADYSAVPYDWRLPLDQILSGGNQDIDGNISYLKATSSPYIMQELRRLVASSQNGKVTIVAHSNGGLLAKLLLKQLADTNDPLLAQIDKLVLVAVPQLGSPSALTGLLHGYEQGIPTSVGPFVSDKVTREFGQNVPGAYNFIPSDQYFQQVNTPVVTFDSTMPDWIAKYGTTTTSVSGLQNFLTDSYGRVASDSGDTVTPTSLNANMVSTSQTTHTTLDNWTPPPTLELIEIAGWGIPTTVSGVKYSIKSKLSCTNVGCVQLPPRLEMEPTFTIDGDGTVVTPSALYSNGYASTTRYWMDLDAYDTFFVLGRKHPDIFEVPDIINLIKDSIINSTLSNYQYISTSVPTSQSATPRLIYSLHSPLTLDIYDSLGNHTGVSTTTGQIEEQIPGTYFLQFGEVKYIFTDTYTPVTVSMSGYDTGTFTFAIQQLQDDTSVSSVTFQDIPTTPTTKVSMIVGNDINTLSALDIDSDNNDTSDITITPILNDIVTYTAPEPIPEPVPPPTPPSSGGGGPLLPNIDRNIHPEIILEQLLSTSTPIQIESISTTTITKVVLKRSDLENQKFKGQTLGSKPQKPIIATTTIEHKTQTAQVISSLPNRFLSRISYFLSLPVRAVNWSLSIFKRD